MEEKSRNKSSYGEEDKISRLPDSLIHQILSFLIDTKYAVQTSVLSKRWIDVWKSLPILKFNRNSFSDENTMRFIDFVHMVFVYRDNTNIQKFSLDWKNSGYDIRGPMSVNIWIAHAVKCNVQEIIVRINEFHGSPYEIPHHLLNSKSLRKLEMNMSEPGEPRHVSVIVPTSMNLPQLKQLSLFGLSISGIELVSKILFSSSPVLEDFVIANCDIQTDNHRNWIVNSVSLKEFECDTIACTVKLCTPNLELLSCRSCFEKDYSLEICSPVVSKVFFNMFLEDGEDEKAEAYEILPSAEKELFGKRMMKSLGEVLKKKGYRNTANFSFWLVSLMVKSLDDIKNQYPNL